MEFLCPFLRCHLAGKPVVASPNVSCLLRLEFRKEQMKQLSIFNYMYIFKKIVVFQGQTGLYRPPNTKDLFCLAFRCLFPNSNHVMFAREFTLCLFISAVGICTWLAGKLRETVLRGNIT